LYFAADLVQLPPFLAHARLVLRPLHALAQLIHVREHLLLLLAQAFQSPRTSSRSASERASLQSSLQFLEPLVQVLLAAGEFLQTVEHLQLPRAVPRFAGVGPGAAFR